MTGLLEDALRRLEALPEQQQDAIAAQIIETLDEDEAWSIRFQKIPAALLDLADQAEQEHQRGETRPLDELLA